MVSQKSVFCPPLSYQRREVAVWFKRRHRILISPLKILCCFKKLKNGISEPITRKELIYSIQVEMAEKYEYPSLKKFHGNNYSSLPIKEKLILTFYNLFEKIDKINKVIDNMVYLKFLNKKEESDEEEEEEEESDEEEILSLIHISEPTRPY